MDIDSKIAETEQYTIHGVSKSFVCDEEDKKTICNNPMSQECCNKHNKRI